MMRARLMIAATLLAATMGAATPATAQRGTPITIFGNDKCPTGSDGSEINICVRAPESDRFRIPETLRETNNPVPAATAPIDAMRATDNGTIGTCSASGPGGMIGCQRAEFAKARAENKARKAATPVID